MQTLEFLKKVPVYIYILVSIVICIIISFLIILLLRSSASPDTNESRAETTTSQSKQIEEVIWQENALIQEVPSHASKVRLSLPVPLDSILLGPQYHFQGFGAHLGDRSEGVEVVAFTLKPGTQIHNLADGTVMQVIQGDDYMGCQVQINYDDGLSGRHHFLKECLVEKGEEIKEGHLLGEGNSIGDSYPSVELLLRDENRTDGARSEFGQGSAVSMFDYLKKEDQEAFIARFEEEILKPYIENGQNAGEVTLWEPFLTNKVLIHEGNKGKLTGEWLLTEQWGQDRVPDIISFLDVDHMYWKGTHMRAIDAYDYNAIMSGPWEVDYVKAQVKITGDQGTFYGIFEIDESDELATLKFEYQQGPYPTSFSQNAIEYVERKPVNMYDQAREMGVLEDY